MQVLIDNSVKYSTLWDIKFNANKCVVMNAGYKLYNDDDIHIKMDQTKIVSEFKFLGLQFNNTNNFNVQISQKFRSVEKRFYSLNEMA